PDDPGAVRDQPLGLSIARAAIAETGSAIMVEPDVRDRAVTLMTQTLVIVCPLAALVPSLEEAATILREISERGASYATFITGPSRTADIERELTVGVQGPGKLHIIFVNALS
ncbi:MAG: lactate utilization protein, partial [Chloroflexota bacterium]|nr:lactate utilization protein [Chloroflexota bacterium]